MEARDQAITIKKKVTDSNIEDIIVGIIEGGCDHFLAISRKENPNLEKYSKAENGTTEPLSIQIKRAILDGQEVYFHDVEDKEERWGFFLVDLMNGITQYYEEVDSPNDFDDMDAEDYDAIMQFSLFKEIRYS